MTTPTPCRFNTEYLESGRSSAQTQPYLESCGIGIQLKSDFVSPLQFMQAAGHLIPDLQQVNSGSSDLTMEITQGPLRFECNQNGFTIGGAYTPSQVIMDSIMLLSKYLERDLNARGAYSVHSSAIGKAGRGIILAGGSGVGKTTVAAYLHGQDSEADIISGDRTVISGLEIVGGTRTLLMRKGSVLQEFSPHQNLKGNVWQTLEPYRNSSVKQGDCRIAAIVLPMRRDCPFHTAEVTGDQKFLRLFENISYFSDYFPNVCLGQKRPLPSFNDHASTQLRIEYVQQLCEAIPVHSAVGSVSDLGAFVAELLRR